METDNGVSDIPLHMLVIALGAQSSAWLVKCAAGYYDYEGGRCVTGEECVETYHRRVRGSECVEAEEDRDESNDVNDS